MLFGIMEKLATVYGACVAVQRMEVYIPIRFMHGKYEPCVAVWCIEVLTSVVVAWL